MGQQFLEHDYRLVVLMPFKFGEDAAVGPQSAKELAVYAPVGLFLGFQAKVGAIGGKWRRWPKFALSKG